MKVATHVDEVTLSTKIGGNVHEWQYRRLKTNRRKWKTFRLVDYMWRHMGAYISTKGLNDKLTQWESKGAKIYQH